VIFVDNDAAAQAVIVLVVLGIALLFLGKIADSLAVDMVAATLYVVGTMILLFAILGPIINFVVYLFLKAIGVYE